LGGEDFSYYLLKVPEAFFRLGNRNEAKGTIHPCHSAPFNVEEDILPLGVETFVRIIDEFLGLKIAD